MLERLRKAYREIYLKRLIKRGLTVGKNLCMEKGCNIDANFPWLISIGDNVIMAPWVYILSHDTSSKRDTGYTRIGKVEIGDNVFIGARTTILPNVKIGSNVIIGANSVVTHDVEDDHVVAGIPAKVIMKKSEFRDKQNRVIKEIPIYDRSYTIWGGCSDEKKKQMLHEIGKMGAFVKTDKADH